MCERDGQLEIHLSAGPTHASECAGVSVGLAGVCGCALCGGGGSRKRGGEVRR